MPHAEPPAATTIPPWSPRAALAGARLLITGGTGFLGKVLVALLLEEVPDLGGVILVARGRRRQTAADRVRGAFATHPAFRSLRARYGDGLPARLADVVTVVDGDVALPLCGIDDAAADALTGRVDAVVHVAGLTDFDPDPAQALAVNVRGARHAADLAARVAGGRLLHVSTAFVVGRREGRVAESLVPGLAPNGAWFDPDAETEALASLCGAHPLPSERLRAARDRAHALGWPNVYTYTKGLAEHHLGRRGDVDVVFARPAVVESARRTPFPGYVEGINTSSPIVWLLSGWLRALPAGGDVHFDVVPVDTTARGLALLLARHLQGDAPRVAHLGTSDVNPLRFGRALDLTALAARRMHGRRGASGLARFVYRQLDAVPRPYDDAAYGLPLLRRAVQGVRGSLRGARLEEWLPPALYRRHGVELDDRRRRAVRDLRDVDRVIGRAQEILRAYRPFTHDHDWVFESTAVHALSDAVVPGDREAFAFDARDLDWRRYWVDVHVPGLERWSWPLFRGERPPEDPAPAWARAPRIDDRPSDGAAEGATAE